MGRSLCCFSRNILQLVDRSVCLSARTARQLGAVWVEEGVRNQESGVREYKNGKKREDKTLTLDLSQG